ncbi:chemotaxis protein CheA [Nitrogeniibacter mangrovi]|uniref:Chemotaxis protein CheA n=1 Tax=Nitrogeniibacter mangrovi TaxID=2016596 RepID=A0A6C1B3Q4_9RHOO|nr:chemotaxis protein CheW [Nitrogeniibacter mangrovi]QID18276.1 chemotaxis protein CheA [Nitrogeniibacter mangrovi]
MTIDMSQFYQVFFEETAEHLRDMESLLVAVDIDAPDPEDLNAIFRAAHSIKGSSGTFGFHDMADVTHVTETLLDMVRKGSMRLSSDIVDACLSAGDVLQNLLAAHRGEATADTDAADAIRTRLEALCNGEAPSASDPAPPSALDIRFVLDERARGDRSLIEAMMDELRAHGALTVTEPDDVDGPWRLRLETDADPADVAGIIGFVAAADSLDVELLQEAVSPADAAGDDDFGFFDDPGESATTPADDADDDGFGFFDDLPAVAATGTADEDDGFGLFDADTPVEAADPQTAAQDDDGFGFFDAPVVPEAAGEAAGQEADFGFFAPVPAGPEGAAAPAAVKPAESAPQRGAAPARASGKPAGDSSIRVSVEKVDQMINLVGELVITQAMLQQSASDIDPVLYERLMSGLGQLERNTRDLQESVMSIRMMPISMVFSRFPRVVRDVSRKLGKKVELKVSGESTELDKGLIERIADPLTHLVRNSLDHGIENPERRRDAGKVETGTITLNASHQGGYIIIEVGDDGAGLNRDKILAKARERGLHVSEGMSDAEVWQLIFEPGFSTADQVTDVSGRGVGMDVVKRNIAQMGGTVDIESMTGIGTRISVRLPLTLAILDGMSIDVGGETYVLPLNYIVESLQPESSQIRPLAKLGHVIQVRGEYLPVIRMHEVLGCQNAPAELTHGLMIVVEANGAKAALFVDALLAQHQVVIKSLDANFRRVQGISGATIMGDGRVALIIDVAGVIALSQSAVPLAA